VVDDGSTPTYNNFTIEYVHFKGAGGVGSSLPSSMSTPVPSLHQPQHHALHDLGCNGVVATTTIADDPMHSSINGHLSGHVHSDTSLCRAQPGGVRYPALPRRRAYWHSCILRATTASLGLSRRPGDTRHGMPRCSRRWTQLRRTKPRSLLISLVVTAQSLLSGCSS
jgi:hypothetical protein